MARRGRCRCGSVLRFEKGPNGYKTRCPSCGSVVRLRPAAARLASRKRTKAERTVTCEVCQTMVPAQAARCPGCGSALDRTTAASSLQRDNSSMSSSVETRKSFPHKLVLGWVMAGAGLIGVIALFLSLRH
jgi:rRNA maturation endonuclease Nob1